MNELDSHLEKTPEIFKIGSVEKKLQLIKVGNKSNKSIRFLGTRICTDPLRKPHIIRKPPLVMFRFGTRGGFLKWNTLDTQTYYEFYQGGGTAD